MYEREINNLIIELSHHRRRENLGKLLQIDRDKIVNLISIGISGDLIIDSSFQSFSYRQLLSDTIKQ